MAEADTPCIPTVEEEVEEIHEMLSKGDTESLGTVCLTSDQPEQTVQSDSCDTNLSLEIDKSDNDTLFQNVPLPEPIPPNSTSKNSSDDCKPKQLGGEFYQSTDTKKSKMRTANDVISRIRWDPDLPAQHIKIGYLDRFNGILEKPFNAFTWEDVASVDYDVLAIPKHRIVYFKYRNEKIWDKNERLDLVFGSTESSKQMDIRELVVQLDEEHNRFKEDFLESDSDSDSDSYDAGIRIALPRSFNPQPPLRDSSDVRPNYFVAIRVTNPDVLANISEVKKSVINKDPKLIDFMMPDGSFHITLAMIYLPEKEDVQRAITTLKECWKDAIELMKTPIIVSLEGLKTFNEYVLYVCVNASSNFYELRTVVMNHLTTSQVQLVDNLRFVPHVTLLKLTKSRSRCLRSPYVDPYVYIDHKDRKFGSQVCDNINLCVIGDDKQLDGFYICATKMQFCPVQNE